MSYVTLAEAKKHLAVFHNADDEIIQIYIDAAEQYAADFMGRPALTGEQCHPWLISPCDDAVSDVVSDPVAAIPPSVKVAVLLILTDYYENRSAGVAGTIYTKLPAAEAMLHFHRVGLGI